MRPFDAAAEAVVSGTVEAVVVGDARDRTLSIHLVELAEADRLV